MKSDTNDDPEQKTYTIRRYFYTSDRSPEVVKTGLTLEEAKAHCRRADTAGEGWFDGFGQDPE